YYVFGAGSTRVDALVRGMYFNFNRTYPGVGYWNPDSFRQFMGGVSLTRRRGEELTALAHAAAGVQRQNDDPWQLALYLHGELAWQVTRRTDLSAAADYGTSGAARQTSAGYSYWS